MPLVAELALEAYRGHVVLVDFFASWCEPCRKATPHYAQLKKSHLDLEIVIVDLDETSEVLLGLLPDPNVVHVVLDPNSTVAAACLVETMPTVLIFDRKSVLRERLQLSAADPAIVAAKVAAVFADDTRAHQ